MVVIKELEIEMVLTGDARFAQVWDFKSFLDRDRPSGGYRNRVSFFNLGQRSKVIVETRFLATNRRSQKPGFWQQGGDRIHNRKQTIAQICRGTTSAKSQP